MRERVFQKSAPNGVFCNRASMWCECCWCRLVLEIRRVEAGHRELRGERLHVVTQLLPFREGERVINNMRITNEHA